jgi:hypothetical protein
MIVWYLRRNQFVQAVALAREWVVSWAMAAAGETDLLARDRRESVEWTLNGIARESQTASAASPSLPELERSVRALPDIRRAATVFQQIGQMRNDLLHAGKNRQPLQSGKLEEKIRNLSTQLDTFRLDG